MQILIATGVYPPNAGGPSYYAYNLKEEFEKLGHVVTVKTYSFERKLPTGVRHFLYLLKTLSAFVHADLVIALDTFSVGLPIALLQKVFHRCVLLRTGGDFLWEAYVERTKEKILLSNFYTQPRTFTFKEKLIFGATKFTLQTISQIIFSTTYQRDIWMEPYELDSKKISIIENRWEPAVGTYEQKGKTFIYAAARPLVWKNADLAQKAFAIAQKSDPDIKLEFLFDIPREQAIEKLRTAYAVILTSLGDISPNYILRALSYGKPVILTTENGLKERLKDAVLYVDPLDAPAIAKTVLDLCGPNMYAVYKQKVASLSYTHTYRDIATEFLKLHTSACAS